MLNVPAGLRSSPAAVSGTTVRGTEKYNNAGKEIKVHYSNRNLSREDARGQRVCVCVCVCVGGCVCVPGDVICNFPHHNPSPLL